jgi:hypothetical protein
MLAQDLLTGYVHEVPDIAGYDAYGDLREDLQEIDESPDVAGLYGYGFAEDPYGEVVYDGLGNPVGLLPAIAAAALPSLTKSILPKLIPQVTRRLPFLRRSPLFQKALPFLQRAGLPMGPAAPFAPPIPGMLRPQAAISRVMRVAPRIFGRRRLRFF